MCQAASSSPTEHVQNRPPALHVRSEYARDVHRDELVQIPKGGECNFNHLFYLFLLFFLLCWEQSPPWMFLLLFSLFALCCPSTIRASTASRPTGSHDSSWYQRKVKALHPLCVRLFNVTPNMKTLITLFTPPPILSRVRLPECFVCSHMVQGIKFSCYF